MSKFTVLIIICFIKFYKIFISSILGNRCRYLPTCSEYFIESLRTHNLIKGSYFGFKRILRCHPIKLLGGSSGLDYVPNKKISKGKS